MPDWTCSNCGKRTQGEIEPLRCPACSRVAALTAITTPEDAPAAKVKLPDGPREGAFRDGLPPAPLPTDGPVPSIQVEDQPTRHCAKCGSIMKMYLCENVLLYGAIPAGKRMYFRCTECDQEIMLRSLGRIFGIALGCPVFVLIVIGWIQYGGLGPLIFAIAFSAYPVLLVLEAVTRFRYARAGGGFARSLGAFTMSAEPPAVYDTLFGDLPMGRWPEGSLVAGPWNAFVKARRELAGGRREAAFACWREVLAQPAVESRHHLQAWHFLRQFGQPPPPEIALQVLGVVVEVGMPQGRDSSSLSSSDILVAYADRSARYYDFAGAGMVWERPDHSLDGILDRLLGVAAENVAQFEPGNAQRPPPPAAGQARISILTPSGSRVLQGPMETLESNHAAEPLMQAGTQLLQELVDKASSRGKQTA